MKTNLRDIDTADLLLELSKRASFERTCALYTLNKTTRRQWKTAWHNARLWNKTAVAGRQYQHDGLEMICSKILRYRDKVLIGDQYRSSKLEKYQWVLLPRDSSPQ